MYKESRFHTNKTMYKESRKINKWFSIKLAALNAEKCKLVLYFTPPQKVR